MARVRDVQDLLLQLGEALRSLRLGLNLGQQELAARAGVGRSAVQNLESGRGTLSTLVRVVRSLGREDWFDSLDNQPSINPLHMTRDRQGRQRASGARRGDPTQR